MSDAIRQAAEALIARWETPLWKDAPATAVYINALRSALSAPPVAPDAQAVELLREARKVLGIVSWCIPDNSLEDDEAERIEKAIDAFLSQHKPEGTT